RCSSALPTACNYLPHTDSSYTNGLSIEADGCSLEVSALVVHNLSAGIEVLAEYGSQNNFHGKSFAQPPCVPATASLEQTTS
ncbi:unnamed protein product, partial [Linum tenue]